MSDSTTDFQRATATDHISRRRLLRTGGGIAAAVTVGLPAASGGVSAQSEGENEEQDGITTSGVLSNSTPKFGKSDFTGLYLRIEDPHNNPDTTGVSSCRVIESDDRVAAYNAVISEKVDVGSDAEAERTVIYIPAQDSTVGTGKQFVINSQTECSGGYTSVQLEQVGASSIGTATAGETETAAVSEATETTESGPVTDEPESAGTTETSSPGFSALTGILGVGTAGLAALKRVSERDD